MVHSAEWTEIMHARLDRQNSLRARKQLVRIFGYRVPSDQRATASATSDLALLAQHTIQPYQRKPNGSVVFNESHYYPCPGHGMS